MNLLVVWRQGSPAARGPAANPTPAAGPAPAVPRPAPAASAAPAVEPDDQAVPARQQAPPVPRAPADASGSFLDRLPPILGRDVVWLQAQEHYLSVTTSRGHHLLLQAFGPAVADVDRLGLEGMQVHRSAWVAWAHVQRLDGRARSPAVVLRDGTRVAVGRRRLPEVAQAWAARGREQV